MAEKEDIRLVTVWEWPVRFTHWLIFLSITTCAITGYLIGNPPSAPPTEASREYLMGTIRYIHFVSAYILLFAFIIRLYWGFVGNRYSRWSMMLPLRKWQWKRIVIEMKDLLFPRRFHASMGHKPLANLTYIIVYLLILFAIVTGFTIYSAASTTPFWSRIYRIGTALLGSNLNQIHLWHHLLLWVFAVFFIIHLYLVVFTVISVRASEIDSMISGKKFIAERDLSPEEQ